MILLQALPENLVEQHKRHLGMLPTRRCCSWSTQLKMLSASPRAVLAADDTEMRIRGFSGGITADSCSSGTIGTCGLLDAEPSTNSAAVATTAAAGSGSDAASTGVESASTAGGDVT
jgi:hypothetical protein